MSIDAHPNINAAGFAVDIMEAFTKRLRGKAGEAPAGEACALLHDTFTAFVVDVSTVLDENYGIDFGPQ